jgi:hypothetical protein
LDESTNQGTPAERTSEPTPVSEPIPENHTPNPDPCAESSKRDEAPASPFDISMLRWTRVVAVFTAVLAFVGGAQTWAFIQSERAYLTFTNFNFIGGLVANQPLSLLFQAKNSGKSAAEIRNISVTTAIGINYPLKYDRLLEVAVSPIEAGATSQQIYVGKNPDGSNFLMNPFTVNDVTTGKSKFYVFGFADYEDDFSIIGSRRSYFCYLYLPERSAPSTAAFGGCPITEKH